MLCFLLFCGKQFFPRGRASIQDKEGMAAISFFAFSTAVDFPFAVPLKRTTISLYSWEDSPATFCFTSW